MISRYAQYCTVASSVWNLIKEKICILSPEAFAMAFTWILEPADWSANNLLTIDRFPAGTHRPPETRTGPSLASSSGANSRGLGRSDGRGRKNYAKTKSRREDMSGVGFLAAVKTFTPAGRRRRRCEKQQKVLELPPGYGTQPDVVPPWDAAPPITPPAAFLPPGYKKGFPGERSPARVLNKSILYHHKEEGIHKD